MNILEAAQPLLDGKKVKWEHAGLDEYLYLDAAEDLKNQDNILTSPTEWLGTDEKKGLDGLLCVKYKLHEPEE